MVDGRSDHDGAAPPDWRKATVHPLRRKTLTLYLRASEPLSPKDVTVELFGWHHTSGELGMISYHVRKLVVFKMLEPAGSVQTEGKGTMRHLYVPTEAASLDGHDLVDEMAQILRDYAESPESNVRSTLSTIAALIKATGRSVPEVNR